MTALEMPTAKWLACAPPELPQLEGPAAVAERLVLLVHYGIDWENGWLASRRRAYWDHHLPDRVRLATYRSGSSLDRWWSYVAEQLESTPKRDQRRELTTLLQEPAKPVLMVLRLSSKALVLRTQTVAEEYRDSRRAENRTTI